MITVTFIRHGESEDNKTQVWAGWKDSPLSELGRKQANILGEALSSTRITHVYASPLLRAHATGFAVHATQPSPQPPFMVNPNLREQHFGIAEGHPWTFEEPEGLTPAQMYERGIFAVLYGRGDKFPDGESLDDLAARAAIGIQECVLPHLGQDGVHVALASHGLCISELVSALLRLDPNSRKGVSYAGLVNTGWTRVEVDVDDGHLGPFDPNNPPPLKVRVTHVNNHDHLRALENPEIAQEDAPKLAARAYFAGQGAETEIRSN